VRVGRERALLLDDSKIFGVSDDFGEFVNAKGRNVEEKVGVIGSVVVRALEGRDDQDKLKLGSHGGHLVQPQKGMSQKHSANTEPLRFNGFIEDIEIRRVIWKGDRSK
jgi:hypothetical protein